MGIPFLILIAAHGVPAIVVVLLLFVVGEMLWVPTSQAIAVRLAPEALRGAYMGAYFDERGRRLDARAAQRADAATRLRERGGLDLLRRAVGRRGPERRFCGAARRLGGFGEMPGAAGHPAVGAHVAKAP
jgi:hypothetical protein